MDRSNARVCVEKRTQATITDEYTDLLTYFYNVSALLLYVYEFSVCIQRVLLDLLPCGGSCYLLSYFFLTSIPSFSFATSELSHLRAPLSIYTACRADGRRYTFVMFLSHFKNI